MPSSLPQELAVPPPRDPEKGRDLHASGHVALVGAGIATGAMLPAIVLGNWRANRAWDPIDASMIFGYAWTLVAAIVLCVVYVRVRRVRMLYRDGLAIEALIETIRFEPAAFAQTRATMELRYVVGGHEHRQPVTIRGALDETVVARGGAVPILVDPRDESRFAVYTRTTGLVLPRR